MKKTAFLVLMICALFEARGQKVSDPRSSSFWSKPQQLGISLGFGGIMQTGTLIADECNCSFENGGGMSSWLKMWFGDWVRNIDLFPWIQDIRNWKYSKISALHQVHW
jgi:hypothetical protein